MIVEVVAVGTELLLGQIVNGNAATIGSHPRRPRVRRQLPAGGG
jgi:hypothetical protein